MQHTVNEICTKMANPSQGSWKRLKKAVRHLKGAEKLTWAMRAREHDEMKFEVRVDSDWSKGPKRKSTRGGMMMISGTVVKHGSRKHATRALSTSEAVFYAVVTGPAETLGMQSMMTDFGL